MPTYEELISISCEDLVKAYNDNMTSDPNIQNMFMAQSYRDELVKRSQDKTTKRILFLTWVIVFLTPVLVVGLVIQIRLAWN
jgi:hypothetical protein